MFGLLLIVGMLVGMLVGIWVAGWIFVEIMKALQSWKAERIHDKKMKTDPKYKTEWEAMKAYREKMAQERLRKAEIRYACHDRYSCGDE